MRLPSPAVAALALGTILALGTAACHQLSSPTVPALRRATPKVPVVLVPGITGSELRDRVTGAVAWGTGARLLSPRDGGYALALPIADPDGPSRLEPFAVIERMSIARVVRKPIYGPVLDLLTAHGYQRGDLRDPRPEDTAFFFPYDWRRDNVTSARQLREALDRLRRARGEARLRVDLICQSNGAHICRYLAKYGGAPLAEAEAGRAGPPPEIAVRRLILVGTANGGAIRILREVDRGRSYVPLVGRVILPEVLFTFPSIYQDLPVYRPHPFLGTDGEELAVDLFDPASWQRYGWSAFDPEVRRRIERKAPELFGDEAQRLAFLADVLDRAVRFHRLLMRDVAGFGEPPAAPEVYLVQNVYTETADRAVLSPRDGGWQTLFTDDPELRERPYLHALASAPGDGHATRTSQLWLSPQETAALAGAPFYVVGRHFELILEPASLRRLAEILAAVDR